MFASIPAPAHRLFALSLALVAAGCEQAPIDDAEVVAEVDNDLACTLVWSTEEPASTRVEFGEGEERDWFLEGEGGEATEHELRVHGMRPERTYSLWAVSVTASGEELRSSPLEFTTGPTPFADLVIEVPVLDTERMQRGWTLTNVAVGGVNYPATAVMFDAEGFPVWYHQLGSSDALVDLEVGWTDGGRVTLGGSLAEGSAPVEVDLAGQVVWSGPIQPAGDQLLTPGQMHHSFSALPGGDHLVLFYDGKDNEIFDVVERIGPDGEVTWRWSGDEHLPEDIGVYPWGNAALVDDEQGVAYYNARMADRLFQVDLDTGEVIWALGEGGDFTPDPDAEFPWFTGAHAPEIQPDGAILLYDNGGPERGFSRAVEYELDLSAMEATVRWEYPGTATDDPWYCAAMGDADRLANGNTLVTAGSLFDDNSRSQVFEVTADGATVWEMRMRGANEGLAAPYMAERIPVLLGEL